MSFVRFRLRTLPIASNFHFHQRTIATMSNQAKIVLVTGANNGVGYETVKALLQSNNPYHVIACSRSVEKGKTALETIKQECSDAKNSVELLQLDLVSDASIENATEHVKNKHGYLDVLINNAAATFDLEYLAGRCTLREAFTKSYDANVAGTQVLTFQMMPLLLKSPDPRLIFVSGLSHITQASEKFFPTPPQPAGWPKNIDFETIGYRCSKNALNMLTVDWNHKLKEDGVKVWAVLPGFLATGLGNVREKAVAMGARHPSEGGTMLLSVVEGKRDGDTGKLIHKGGVERW